MRKGLFGRHSATVSLFALALACLTGGFAPGALAEDKDKAFDDRFMFRISSYFVKDADTDIAVADTTTGVGATFSFNDDLGGDDEVTIPRIDAYYRFNDRHRIDFSYFRIERDGRKALLIEVDFDDDSFDAGDTVTTSIDYELLKIGYGYSFYRSDRVELSLTAGLNITTYDFQYELEDGSRGDNADATGPLPMFGLRLSYAITPKWSVHYQTESFYIEIEDTLDGSFITNEINLDYRFNQYFELGVGLTRFSTDLDASDDDWRGGVSDSHRGALIYATLYLN